MSWVYCLKATWRAKKKKIKKLKKRDVTDTTDENEFRDSEVSLKAYMPENT
jgi:hypothetical protein